LFDIVDLVVKVRADHHFECSIPGIQEVVEWIIVNKGHIYVAFFLQLYILGIRQQCSKAQAKGEKVPLHARVVGLQVNYRPKKKPKYRKHKLKMLYLKRGTTYASEYKFCQKQK
jgi:hypothetical protein